MRYVMIALAVALCCAPQGLESSLAELFKSLSEDQKKACLKSYDDPNRDEEKFPGGPRPGVQIRDLSDAQYKLLDQAVKGFLSENGYKQALQVAAQGHKNEGFRDYWMNFFGDPTKDKAWAFRVSEHHLTLVHINSDPLRFGPVLLGANPPDVWKDQEDAALECFKKLTAEDKARCVLEGHSLSGKPLGNKGGVIGDLTPSAKGAAIGMLEARLQLFSEEQQRKIRKIVEGLGGAEKLRLGFYNEMTKRCADGGKADWKIEGKGFLCDYESHRGHIHFTLRACSI